MKIWTSGLFAWISRGVPSAGFTQHKNPSLELVKWLGNCGVPGLLRKKSELNSHQMSMLGSCGVPGSLRTKSTPSSYDMGSISSSPLGDGSPALSWTTSPTSSVMKVRAVLPSPLRVHYGFFASFVRLWEVFCGPIVLTYCFWVMGIYYRGTRFHHTDAFSLKSTQLLSNATRGEQPLAVLVFLRPCVVLLGDTLPGSGECELSADRTKNAETMITGLTEYGTVSSRAHCRRGPSRNLEFPRSSVKCYSARRVAAT